MVAHYRCTWLFRLWLISCMLFLPTTVDSFVRSLSTSPFHWNNKCQITAQRPSFFGQRSLPHHRFIGFSSTISLKWNTPSDNVQQDSLVSSTAKTAISKSQIENVLLVECGFGNDSHGQNATKAAIRACRNAIEFNSVSIKRIVPGGYDNMKVHVILAVPPEYSHTLDVGQVATVFPFGQVTFEIRQGGMIAPSGRVIESLGDRNDDMVMVCAAVQVGY